MKKVFAFTSALILIIINVFYCVKIINGTVSPTLTTWMLWLVAVGLSFLTYCSTEKHNWKDNIINTIDLVFVFSITIVTVCFGHNPNKFNFNGIEKICLLLSIIVFIYWKITKSHVRANISLQVVMVIAYLPTFYNLWFATVLNESLLFWSLNWVAGFGGVAIAIIAKDKLALFYSGRSFVMLTFVIALILRLMYIKGLCL